MSQVINATISNIAESFGITHIKEPVYAKIANSTQREILKVLADSHQLMVTSKRTRLRVSDINTALEANGMEPVFGYSSGEAPGLLNAGNVNALDLYVYNDHQIPIDMFNRFEPAPYPYDTSFDFEWITIAGKPLAPELADEQQEAEQISEELKVATNQPKQKIDQDLEFASSKHVFSYELQLFYKKLRERLLSDNSEEREKMFKNLHFATYIQTLLPYFLRFSLLLLRDYPNRYDMLYVSVSTIRALVSNRSLRFLNVYMPHFITVALSCLLSPQIGPKLWNELFILRTYSVDLLRCLLRHTFEQGYSTVQPRITAQFLGVLLRGTFGLTEKCGALQGLLAMSLETASKFVLPNIIPVIDELGSKNNEGDLNESQLRMHFYSLCASAFGRALHADTFRLKALGMVPIHGYSKDLYRDMMDTFGSDATHYVVDDSAFMYL
ncbi:putative TBP-associated protein [Tritrichomonas foetus]|uniref:TBP-associated protein n=1 Tax=Tritrichomonas foetus TaxID=1144522 RepID=A0A1J4KMH7_9EUKA|nr:putative TBP-associated protein [Tritrichomonas foetus]|eukprot:OHT10894.1 putative TBP-associated protein [Tritrichomonas foetus]